LHSDSPSPQAPACPWWPIFDWPCSQWTDIVEIAWTLTFIHVNSPMLPHWSVIGIPHWTDTLFFQVVLDSSSLGISRQILLGFGIMILINFSLGSDSGL
jgi:hypothetical protein